MREDLSRYSPGRKRDAQVWYKQHVEQYGIGMCIALMAISSGCPSIVTTCWVAEIEGWTPEVVRIFNVIRKYYGYTQILGKLDGFPD
jgi:hypothetical protein